MYEEVDIRQHRSRSPSLLNTLTELPRALLEFGSLYSMMPALSLQSRGDKHPLLLIPGFLAGDASLATMKRYLRNLGYRPETWGFGRNMGKPDHLFDHLPEKLLEMADRQGEPVSLIGQSLGGVYARELAREYPDLVRQVITMGSPFGVKNSASTMRALTRVFKASSGLSIEEMLALMHDRNLHISPDVPVTAIYSKSDGVVHWEACREDDEDHHTQNIEVPGSHCGMAFNPMIYYIVANRLSLTRETWRPFNWAAC